ncbi:hypothetical protein JD974_01790 [Chromobacterium haemolyticum]|uniref:Integrase n=1 Tax=Chromobacterium haemolyticum TaxID=394935 RepID=A0ABS3GI09_9NEIS|nr:hypothetical protein [Chromobacterium haemolyticum]MBK0413127.1 hypothetical protein [Chromobacterium haemolyticum]MBO0414229.1 hypothetical protein [Chromobacterium haemolyticum]MBO0497489.1 hypothetical protein [Chromobacterium haemolyticum]
MKLSARPTVIYDLPLPKGTVIFRPESVILRFPNGKTADIGAICYLRREPAPKLRQKLRKPSEGRQVDLSSLTAKRSERVRALIFHISDELMHSGLRAETVRSHTTRFVAFMFWADANGYHDVLNCSEAARPAIQAYAMHIRERVTTNAISITSGAHQQSAVFGLLERFLEADNLTRGINLLRKNPVAVEVTVPPCEDAQAKVLSLCDALFDGLSSLVLEAKPYPYALALPKHLDYPNNTLWIFPTISWFMSPQMLIGREDRWRQNSGYNYREGRLSTLDEMQAMKSHLNDGGLTIGMLIRNAKRQLQTANSNPRHTQRRHLGMVALNTFILMFLAQTGMNWAQVVNLTWEDEYDVSATHQVFRTIKWRAQGRKVSFELPVAFMPKFKRYLELRKYLLGGRPCNWLFFKLGTKGAGEPEQMKSGPLATYRTLQRIDPDLPVVKPREWRAAKSDWLIRNTDPSTAALVLQNSERTVLASYAAGSETSHVEELSKFLDKVSETVVEKGKDIEGSVRRAIGICTAYESPHLTIERAPIKPDCKGQEGCLFCDKFRVHADETDTRKLISCRYCLRQTAPLAGSQESFQALLSPIFNRIESILAEVSRRDEALVIRVTKEVEEEGELDPYWARKFEMLMELGVVV